MTKPWETSPPVQVTSSGEPWKSAPPTDGGGQMPWEQPPAAGWTRFNSDSGAQIGWQSPDLATVIVQPPPKPSPVWERFGTGMMDPIHGMAQMLYNAVPESVRKGGNELNEWLIQHGIPLEHVPEGGLNQMVAEREARIKAGEPEGVDWARVAGGAVSPAYLAVPGMRFMGPIGRAALGGAAAGAAAPVTDIPEGSDYAHEKAKEALVGAGFGVGGGALTSLASRLVRPIFDRSVQTLLDAGVKLTPGQMASPSSIAGRAVRGLEGAATSVPIAGALPASAMRKSLESFNRAVLDKALEPIGKTLPSIVKPGREAYAYVSDQIGNKYKALLPKLAFKIDPQFTAEYGQLRALAAGLPREQARQFKLLSQDLVDHALSPTGTMDGRTFKDLESKLSHKIRNYVKSTAPADREFATALQEMQRILRQGLLRSNPADAPELQAINSAYAAYVRARDASLNRASSGGVFSPNDLLSAIKRSSTRGEFSRGDALLQDLAEAGNIVLPNRVPNSGTADRTMAAELLGGGGAAAAALLGHPLTAFGVGAGMLPYTGLGMTLGREWATPGVTRALLGQALEASAPVIGRAAGTAGTE